VDTYLANALTWPIKTVHMQVICKQTFLPQKKKKENLSKVMMQVSINVKDTIGTALQDYYRLCACAGLK